MRALLITLTLLLGACAHSIPEEIRQAPAENPDLVDVLQSFDYYQGADVRWGGEIVSVRNRAEDSMIEVAARPLDSFGRPVGGDRVLGRFFIRVGEFTEPSVYETGRMITVAGVLEGLHQDQIDQRDYTYPVVYGLTLRLWQSAAAYDSHWGPYPYRPYPPPWFRFRYGYHHHPYYWYYEPYWH